MPLNGFTVGRDIALSIIGPNGPLRWNLITDFKSKPDITDKKIKGIDGITRHVRFPDGHSGSFMIERQGSDIDDYFAQLEADYYAGKNEQSVSITETITEPNGAVSQYRYTGVLLKLDDSGEYKADDTVRQMVSFVASRKIKVA